MDETNPYAAPETEAVLAASASSSWQGLWRDGRDLVLHKNARLPNACVKSGVEVTRRGIRRRMSWHSPWITLSILAGLIVYVILAIFLTKRATVEIPLSDNERGKRRSWIMFSWLLALGSLAGLVACVYVLLDARNPSPFAAIGCLAAIIGFIVALGLGQNTARILRPTRITDSHVWLRGVHSSILEQLPPLA